MKWYSTNNEEFKHSEMDDAVQDVFNDETAKVGDIRVIYEGDAILSKAGQYATSFIQDELANAACDDLGEFADDWPNCTKEQAEELDKAIEDLVNQWADKHGLQPTFGRVENVIEIKVRMLTGDGDWEVVS